MVRRFSDEELYQLRNGIPIPKVIDDLLGIPCKEIEGIYRFLCPLCGEFQTAVNPKTNLSRCFRCRRNFNTIEIVMADRKVPFVEGVKILQNWRIPCQLSSHVSQCVETQTGMFHTERH